MPTIDTTYDNRETCGPLVPSSCLPYTGYVSDTIADLLPCRPNVNDVLKNLQILIDSIQDKLGDNSTLTPDCFTFTSTASQKTINQEIITNLCSLKTQVEALLAGSIDPDDIDITIDLLCLEDPACAPAPAAYPLTEVLTKLVTNYCSLLDRIVTIETTLNIH